MHRAVLLENGDVIGPAAIMLAGSTAPNGAAGEPAAVQSSDATSDDAANAEEAANVRLLVGRTVADVERDLIVDTL